MDELLFNKMFKIISKKVKCRDYFSIVKIIDNLEFKYTNLLKNLEQSIIFEINENLLKEKTTKLINFIKKFPIKSKIVYINMIET